MAKTFLIDLTPSESEIFKGLKRELRQNIYRGDKTLVLVTLDYSVYFHLVKAYRKTKGLITRDIILSDVEYYAAKIGDDLVNGQGIYPLNDSIVEVGIWRIKSAPYYAGDWLKWQMILLAKRKGKRFYDFAGNNGYYKEKWGGFIGENELPEPKRCIMSYLLRPIHRFLVKNGILK